MPTEYDDTITGTPGPDHLDGLGGNDLIYGLEGNDSLFGGASGEDTLYGGLGDDTYVVNSSGDLVTEEKDQGQDLVRSWITYTLVKEVENLELLGSSNIDAVGNALDNRITGNEGNNDLQGASGGDTILGLGGNDTIGGGYGSDWLDGGEGNDNLAGDFDNDTLYGQGGNDVIGCGNGDDIAYGGTGDDLIWGSLGNDTLYGDAGNDTLADMDVGSNHLYGGADNDILQAEYHSTLYGGTGDDTYHIYSALPTVRESAGEGEDFVRADISYTLGENVEHLRLSEQAVAISGIGNALANRIVGNSYGNILNGMLGADSMVGGAGDDTYYVDNVGDTASEAASQGTDQVYSSVSFVLASNVEHLTLTGSAAVNGTGNASDNRILGNSAGNYLIGGLGNDTMTGGAGNDTYEVDSTGDVLTELAGGGTDSVISSITWRLAANLENLTLTGRTDIDATGNAGSNVLIGNAGRNRLIGGLGADDMTGGLGNDTYTVDHAGDVVREFSGQGFDAVRTRINLTLPGETERLVLLPEATNGTGNSTGNILIGNPSANRLNGGAGSDTLYGSGGNDVLIGTSEGAAGRGERDLLNGGGGKDRFILGTAKKMFYDDGTPGTGYADFAYITSFRPADDRLVLKGARASYFLETQSLGGYSGKGLFFDSNSDGMFNGGDELIAIIRSPQPLNRQNTIGQAIMV